MTAPSGKLLQWPPGPATAALLAAALSLAFSLPTLAMLPIWGDEILTLRAIELPAGDLIAERLRNVHSPVYFLAMKAMGQDGESRFLLRLPSALGTAAAAACMALVAFRLGGWRAALALGFAFAAMPAMLVEAQDGRPNAWHFAFLGLFTLSLAALLEHPRLARAALARDARPAARRLRWAWAGATLAALGMVAMLPLGLLAVLAGDVAMLWCTRRGACRRLLRPWFLLRLLTLLLLVPLFVGLVDGFERRVGNYWPPEFGWHALRTVLKVAGGAAVDLHDPNYFLARVGNRFLQGMLGLCILLGLLVGRRRHSFALLVVLAFLPQLVLIALSLNTSLLVGRYFAVSTPALLSLGALGLAFLWSRWPRLTALPALALAVLFVLQSLDAMHQLGKPRFDLAVARLRAAGVTELVINARFFFQGTSALYHLREVPHGVRAKPWQGFVAANRGKTLWVIARADQRIHPAWRFFAEHSQLKLCNPAIDGLRILAISRNDSELAASCPDAAPMTTARAAAAP